MTTPPRLADRVTAIAGSVDLSGFAPFFAPLMFFLREPLADTNSDDLTCRDLAHGPRHFRLAERHDQPGGNSVIAAPHKAPGFFRFGCSRSIAS